MTSNDDKSGGLTALQSPVLIGKIPVYGSLLDRQTRCVHYHSPLDIIAIRFACCDQYYPCYSCHQELAGHPAKQWSKQQWDTHAVLCGQCGNELSINEYMNCDNQCPSCKSPFNPNCEKHYSLYFHM